AMQYRASRYMYDRLVDQGIVLYEYLPSYLHAKVAVIDGHAMVGSANLDPFSSLLAREANVWIQDDAFAEQLTAALEAQLASSCQRVTPQVLERQNRMQRALDALSYRALRMGVALTGKSSEY
ncbi:MAG TPA: phospholipase D-like domain-containing protein, partial [Burkholderiaceae bacterium]|nr:phospholipase D-like domain-containing protein [Burkholderiaceae bacterium]